MANNYDVQPALQDSGNTNLDDKGFISGGVTRNFTIVLDQVDSGDNVESVRYQCQIRGLLPREGDSHPSSFLLFCVGVTVQQITPLYYTATAQYQATPRPQQDPEDPNIAPWDLPTSYTFSSHKEMADVDEDTDGVAIVNPVTSEPVYGIKRRITSLKITATKSVLQFNPALIPNLTDAVNDTTYLGYERGRVLVDDISASPARHGENQTEYYKVTGVFLVGRPYNVPPEETWYHRRIVKGFYAAKVVGTELKVVRAVDAEKNPVTTPVNLNATTGRQLDPNDPPQFKTEKTVFFEDLTQLGF